jgi:hypothetical protein
MTAVSLDTSGNPDLKNNKQNIFSILDQTTPLSFARRAVFGDANKAGSAVPEPGDAELVHRLDLALSELLQQITSERLAPTSASAASASATSDAQDPLAEAQRRFDLQWKALKDRMEDSDVVVLTESQRTIVDQCVAAMESLQKELKSYQLVVSLLNRAAEGKMEDNNCRVQQNRAGQMTVVCPD